MTLTDAAPAWTDAELVALRQRLLRQARLAVADAATAEDLVQETLIAVVSQRATYRGDAALGTWAISILRHKTADWFRSAAVRRETPLPDEGEAALDATLNEQFDAVGQWREAVPAWQQPERSHEQRQMMAVLEGCMGCLPARTRHVFMMREWLGFEADEIRAQLGISADNLRQTLHRARLSLRECMNRRWFGANAARA
jgi:RNA polymerase sigma-70 factor, ECF subfamily